MAEHGHGFRLVRIDNDLAALVRNGQPVFRLQADKLFAAGACESGRFSPRIPTKSVFFLETAQASPASSGVTVPSVSCPTMI